MKIGRNDPCHCGSGQKYKKCHLPKDDVDRSAELAAAAATAAEAQAKLDAEEAEKDEASKAAGERPTAARAKDAGAAKPRTPAPTQAPAFRRKSV